MSRRRTSAMCRIRQVISVLSVVGLVTACIGACPALVAAGQRSDQQRYDRSTYSGLRWRMLGPFRGGRVNAVTGVPGQPSTFYFGSVGGGVWKSTNSGRTWAAIFDSQPIASIGAIAVAQSNSNILYVGSGEVDMRSQISFGNGMYK